LAPSTMMPKFIGDDGTTPIKTVFEGDPHRQFTAIWHYLMKLRADVAAPGPSAAESERRIQPADR
jgi:hypothetical protein